MAFLGGFLDTEELVDDYLKSFKNDELGGVRKEVLKEYIADRVGDQRELDSYFRGLQEHIYYDDPSEIDEERFRDDFGDWVDNRVEDIQTGDYEELLYLDPSVSPWL